jgi:polyisoprenoid-binding protein YceI
MRIANAKSAMVATGFMAATALVLSALAAPPRPQANQVPPQEVVLVLDPAQCKVHYTVDSTLHTVHGTFNLKRGTVHLNPESGKASGEIIVSATSGDSGNTSRDERMHKEILQTQQFPDAVFRPREIEGKVLRIGASDVQLHGVILLHGQEHDMVSAVHADLAADHWTGTAKFDVPYIQWGIKDPSTWLLKVKPVVHLEVDMAGSANQASVAN